MRISAGPCRLPTDLYLACWSIQTCCADQQDEEFKKGRSCRREGNTTSERAVRCAALRRVQTRIRIRPRPALGLKQGRVNILRSSEFKPIVTSMIINLARLPVVSQPGDTTETREQPQESILASQEGGCRSALLRHRKAASARVPLSPCELNGRPDEHTASGPASCVSSPSGPSQTSSGPHHGIRAVESESVLVEGQYQSQRALRASGLQQPAGAGRL